MPSRAVATRIQREHEALMQTIDIPFGRAVYKEKNRYLKSVIANYQKTGLIDNAHLLKTHGDNLITIEQKWDGKAIRAFGKEQLRYHLPKSLTLIEWLLHKDEESDLAEEDLFTQFETQWFKTEVPNAALKGARTTFEDVRRALITGQQGHETTREIINRLKAVDGISKYRAQVIARTETHNAATFAQSETLDYIQEQTQTQQLKYWVNAGDDRVRGQDPHDEFDHYDMDPEDGIPLEDDFDVSGEMMDRPGDPSGSPGNVINCRCVLVGGSAEESG